MPSPLLFLLAVAIWGTTWIAVSFQIDATAPEVGVALRFSLAAALTLAWCRWRGIALRFDRGTHLALALLGAFGFCFAYLLVYHAQRYIVSGLVAVAYASMPLVNMLLARIWLGTPASWRVGVAGAMGLAGIGLIFEPEIARLAAARAEWEAAAGGMSGAVGDALGQALGTAGLGGAGSAAHRPGAVLIGALLAALAVLVSGASNILVARNHTRGVGGWAPLGLAMAWGAATGWLVVLLLGRPLSIAWSWTFALSLAYLAMFGSVLAFGAYYALLGRIGPARAAYTGVMSTVVALVISGLFEGYHWRWTTVAGLSLAVAGNVLALRAAPARAVRPAAAEVG